ncbi:DUF4118 domain-containing protein [Derxia gummosa]|uniref:histidine kinase n=1 Tax=Derxia gummosa DSM 723 TaxID=1121388 RepID=A0A8B6XAZ9_9BURK|nr:DUF4118 domain-containing protein [Derxia gummosa]
MTSDTRPDPERLLADLRADASRAARGRLRIFFGASAGVGKTCAMLVAARAALDAGRPVVTGIIETHGRADTAALAAALPQLPRRAVLHQGHALDDFDLDAALAFGATHAGALVLLDEFAHSNAPGARHPKRWQDADELLAAGIDVWTTLNVQHLDSLNDIVGGITGVRVRETLPDRVFDGADEVVMVDLPPDELLARLKAGKVYLGEQAGQAAAHFFRKGNLLALRELALRRAADRVDGEMQAWRRRSPAAPVWPNRESLLACVGADGAAEKVVRSAARLAGQLGIAWHALHVDTRGDGAPEAALRALRLAEQLGATTAVIGARQVGPALVAHAREHNLARLLIGRPGARAWWRRLGRAPTVLAIARLAPDLDLLEVAAAPPATARAEPPAPLLPAGARHWRGHAIAVAACAAVAVVAMPLVGVLELTNIVMLFLLAQIGVALTQGRASAVVAAFVGVALFDFFFVPPRFTFAVTDAQYLLTFTVMLAVGLVIGQLTAGLKAEAQAARERERRVRRLYEMARELSAALLPAQVAEIGARFISAEFDAPSALLALDERDRLAPLPGAAVEVDAGLARWAFDHASPAGRGTDTLPASTCLVLPLAAPMRTRGVLAIALAADAGPEQRRLLDLCASLLAISLERIHYIDVAQAATVQMESERLRNALLGAISHDLRTPLAGLVGLADTLALARPPLPDEAARTAAAMRETALRMSALVTNLLDMARLESGAVTPRRAWLPLDEPVGGALAACAGVLAGRPVATDLPAELPLLHLDAVLFERVLVNLLENAAKYTPPGTALRIAARLADGAAGDGDAGRGRADAGAVQLTIDDDGPGLPPGREEALFEKFARGERESATPGVGLGLAICRAIVAAHGGTIRAENRAGGGARFTITLPRGTPPADDGSALAIADAGPDEAHADAATPAARATPAPDHPATP